MTLTLGLVLTLGCEGTLTITGPSADGGAVDVSIGDAGPRVDGETPDVTAPSDSSVAMDAPDGGALDGGAPDAGRPDGGPCSAGCGANQACLMGSCSCAAGYLFEGGACVPEAGSDPTLHSEADVCMRWRDSGSGTAGFTVSEVMCDAGQLSPEAIDEGMGRIHFYRWLSGLGPASTAESHVQAQACALVSSWNPAGPAAHSPGPDSVCYSPEGAAGAGSSNIAWGSRTTVAAIDQWVQDNGNATTMGHRRWILNPPLSGVQLGLYRGGTSYGGAACMGVFGRSGDGRRPEWFALPPPGVSPLGLPVSTWTFHASWSFAGVTVQVTRMSDGADLPVTILPLSSGGGGGYSNATSFRPDGWSREAGETYRVNIVAGDQSAEYDVRPVDC